MPVLEPILQPASTPSRSGLRRLPLVFLLGLALTPGWGCATPSPPDLTTIEYAPALSIDPAAMDEREDGLLLRDTSQGSGAAASSGDEVVIHYLGFFPDGTLFDSSLERDEPVRFQLGQGVVIPGWESGIVGMRPGGRRLLVVPPQLAYGRSGIPGHVPPNQVLVFEIRLLELY